MNTPFVRKVKHAIKADQRDTSDVFKKIRQHGSIKHVDKLFSDIGVENCTGIVPRMIHTKRKDAESLRRFKRFFKLCKSLGKAAKKQGKFVRMFDIYKCLFPYGPSYNTDPRSITFYSKYKVVTSYVKVREHLASAESEDVLRNTLIAAHSTLNQNLFGYIQDIQITRL